MGDSKRLWQGMLEEMSGVWQRAGKLCVRTVAEGANHCTLLLFDTAKENSEKAISMKRIGNSSVFYVQIDKEQAAGYDTYLFETEDGRFKDIYAKSISGKEVFGKWQGDVLPKLWENITEEETDFLCPTFSELLFYKLHVRGFTMHGSSGVKRKGTFAGLEEKIPYLKELGINAVLLMPVYEFEECMELSENCGKLSARQMALYEERYGKEFVKVQQSYETDTPKEKTAERINFWGYTGDNYYFAPKAAYAADKQHAGEELKHLVKELHKAGIAVFFEFFFAADVKQGFIQDCLRYWTYVFGADGFRLIGGNKAIPLLLEDPYLDGIKLIVSGEDGADFEREADYAKRRIAWYGDGFRNVMRRFVKGDESMVGEFVRFLTLERPEAAQIHYIADQNGFSLYDLYAYDRKHNESNGEDNKDGEDLNYSWNCGAEGETSKKKITVLRAKLRKNALCTVMLSQSVPMLFAGDEFGHTKQGNNNAYCQDNEVSWLNWRWNKERKELLEFTKGLIRLRKEHSLLSGGRSIKGNDWKGVGVPDVSYHGVMLWQPDYAPYSRTVSVLFSGAYGIKGTEPDLYLLFNMHWEELNFALPGEQAGEQGRNWEVVLDTSAESEILWENKGKEIAVTADNSMKKYVCRVPARTAVVLKRKEE